MGERERWRKARRAPGYKVSSLGRARSLDRTLPDGRQAGGVMLAPWLDSDGYRHITINGEHVPMSHLVLEAFDRLRPYGTEACHGPGGRQDDRAVNLRWGTHRENERDKKRWESRKEDRSRTRPKEARTLVPGGDLG